MRLLLLHASRLTYKLTQKTSFAEEITEDQKAADVGECLAVYVSVEKNDSANLSLNIEGACREIKTVYEKIHPKRIVLNPFAHLSPNLASNENIRARAFKGIRSLKVSFWLVQTDNG